MPKQEQAHKTYTVDARELAEEDARAQSRPSIAERSAKRRAELDQVETDKKKTDDLLDEIDDLLDEVTGEETAQQFVDGYRQKGGQ